MPPWWVSEEVIVMLLVPNICFSKSQKLHYITFIEKKLIPPKFKCIIIIILIQCFLFFCGNFFSFWWLRKTVKEEYSVKDSLLSEKNSPTFRERNYFEKLFVTFHWVFLVESKFSACFLGFGVFLTKQFVVFSSVFSVWNFFGNFATFNGKTSQIYYITKFINYKFIKL
jgi:hypothetical protein